MWSKTLLVLCCSVLVVVSAETVLNTPQCSLSYCNSVTTGSASCLFGNHVTQCNLCALGRACACDKPDIFVCTLPPATTVPPETPVPTTPRLANRGSGGQQFAETGVCAQRDTVTYRFPTGFVLPTGFTDLQVESGIACCPVVTCTTPPPSPTIPCRERPLSHCVTNTGECKLVEGTACGLVTYKVCVPSTLSCNGDRICLQHSSGSNVLFPPCIGVDSAPTGVLTSSEFDACDCRCPHEGLYYAEGSTRQVSCNTCTCRNRLWACTSNICDQPCNCDSLPQGPVEECPNYPGRFAHDLPGCYRNLNGQCVRNRQSCPNLPPGTNPTCECDTTLIPATNQVLFPCPNNLEDRGWYCGHPEGDTTKCLWYNRPCQCVCNENERKPLVECTNAPGKYRGHSHCVHDVVKNECRWKELFCPSSTTRVIVFVVFAVNNDGTPVTCEKIRQILIERGIPKDNIVIEEVTDDKGRKGCRIKITFDVPDNEDGQHAAVAEISSNLGSDSTITVSSIAVESDPVNESAAAALAASFASLFALLVLALFF